MCGKDIVNSNKTSKKQIDADQKTVDRLLRKISELREKIKSGKTELEKALRFYSRKTEPLRTEKLNLQKEFIKKTMPFYLNEKKLSIKQKGVLKEILIQQLNEILQEEQLKDNDELRKIFETLTGETYENVLQRSFEAGKSEIKEMFRKMGFDVNLDHIDIGMSREDILNMLTSKMKEHSKKESDSTNEKEYEPEHINDNISVIYKQLAKVFHPDLEQDPNKKSKKEALMKQLTVAYGNNDLASMLQLEMTYFSKPGKISETSQENIRIYNAILKDQIKKAENELDSLAMHSRYEVLRKYFQEKFDTDVMKQRMQAEILGLREYIFNLKSFLGDLDDPSIGLSELKYMIKEYGNKEV
jgi:hypothetical protein